MEASSPRTEACRRALLSRRQGKARTPCEKTKPKESQVVALRRASLFRRYDIGLGCVFVRVRGGLVVCFGARTRHALPQMHTCKKP